MLEDLKAREVSLSQHLLRIISAIQVLDDLQEPPLMDWTEGPRSPFGSASVFRPGRHVVECRVTSETEAARDNVPVRFARKRVGHPAVVFFEPGDHDEQR